MENQRIGTASTHNQTVAPPLPLGSPRSAISLAIASAVFGVIAARRFAFGRTRAEAPASPFADAFLLPLLRFSLGDSSTPASNALLLIFR